MSKVLLCRSIVPGCNFVVRGEVDEDLVMKEEEHAQRIHDVGHVSEQLRSKIRSAITEEPSPS